LLEIFNDFGLFLHLGLEVLDLNEEEQQPENKEKTVKPMEGRLHWEKIRLYK
jgi:hypothetical protein